MPQEYIFPDFSGGINPSVDSSKLTDRELLQASNLRLDEAGNAASAFPSSVLSTNTDSSGNKNAHSLTFDSQLGSVVGIGQDVFVGATLGGLQDSLAGTNASQSKMSFGTTPSRIVFDVNGVPMFYDPSLGAPLNVDWVPPSVAAGSTTTKTCSTGGTATNAGKAPWSNAGNITGTSGFATVSLSTTTAQSQYLRATGFSFSLSTSTIQGIVVTATAKLSGNLPTGFAGVYATLMKAGVPVGVAQFSDTFSTSNIQLTWGASTFLFGATGLTAADLNNSNFGIQFYAILSANASISPITLSIQNVVATAYQVGTGTVAGTSTAGTNLAGTYTWAITNVGLNGEESDVSNPTLGVALSAAAGTLTSIPAPGDARTVSRNVYRIGGTMNSFYLVGSIPDAVSTTYFDNFSDLSAITEGVIVAGGVAGLPANTRLGTQLGRYPVLHYERLFLCQGNTLIWSAIENIFAWPADNEIPVGDGKSLTGAVSKWGCLCAFKPEYIYLLSGNDESTFSGAKTESIVGTDQPFTIASVEQGIIFTNSQGVWIFNGATSSKLAPKLDLLFKGQSRNGVPAIETVNKAVTANHCAVATADNYYLSCAALGSTSNNLLFVINIQSGAITTRSIDLLSLSVDETSGYVYGGLANGQIIQLDNFLATSDSQGALPWTLQTKYTDCGARGSNLQIWGLELYINTGGNTVTPTVSYDGGNTSEVLAPFSTTSLQRVQRSCESANARKAQNVSVRLDSNIASGSVDLLHVKVTYDVLPGRARTGQ